MDTTIGQRITAWRRRRGGLSQRALADLAGLSQAYISQLEAGQRPLDRKSTQVSIASALNISVAQLLGTPAAGDPVRDRATAHVPEIRHALVELTAGERRPPQRDRDAVRAAVRQLTDWRNEANYASITPVLSDVLRDVLAYGDDLVPEAIETLFAARYVLRSIGHPDLGWMAAELGWMTAQAYADPAWRAQAAYNRVQAFPVESAGLGARVTARMADDLQGETARAAQEMYGCLHVLGALQAAVGGRGDEATARLNEAADVAGSLGEPQRYGPMSAGINGNWFGPTQVEVWRVAVAAELGDAATALAVAARIDLSALPLPNRHVYYHLDMARALAAGDKDLDAMHSLAKAERSAPQHFRFSPVSTELVGTLVHRARRRAVHGEMATLARKLGIDVL
jgi:transcriptional regulator with XRE-family HTH domain